METFPRRKTPIIAGQKKLGGKLGTNLICQKPPKGGPPITEGRTRITS